MKTHLDAIREKVDYLKRNIDHLNSVQRNRVLASLFEYILIELENLHDEQ